MNVIIVAMDIPQVASKSFLYKVFLDLRASISEPTNTAKGAIAKTRTKKIIETLSINCSL